MEARRWNFVVIVLAAVGAHLVAPQPSPGGETTTDIRIQVPDIGSLKIIPRSRDTAVVTWPTCPQGGAPGDPSLPYYWAHVVLPPDANLHSAEAQLVSGEWQKLTGKYDVLPASPSVTRDRDHFITCWERKNETSIVDGRDVTVYGKDAYFPSKVVEVVSTGRFRQWKVATLRVWLAQYNPVQKNFRSLTGAAAVLSVQKLPPSLATGLDSPRLPLFPGTERHARKLEDIVANPRDLERFYGTPEGGERSSTNPDYVIITTQAIVSGSQELSSFVGAKTARGRRVKVVTEGTVQDEDHYLSGSNATERANNIRGYLKLYYLTWGIDYVLLLGNPQQEPFYFEHAVPMKKCWPRQEADEDKTSRTDMFYAELSSQDWDGDGDGDPGDWQDYHIFHNPDDWCEVSVGRIPHYGGSDFSDLDSILDKTIDYQNAQGDLSWRNEVQIAGAIGNFAPQNNDCDEDLDIPADEETFLDDWGEALKNLANGVGLDTYTLYEKEGVYPPTHDPCSYPDIQCDAALNWSNFIGAWAMNDPGCVVWAGHGLLDMAVRFRWVHDSDDVGVCNKKKIGTQCDETDTLAYIESKDAMYTSKTYQAFVLACSCHNGEPITSNNLAYSLLKAGAVATLASSEVTWYIRGHWNPDNNGQAQSYGYYCLRQLAEEQSTFGEALSWCRLYLISDRSTHWMNKLSFNIYGDPELEFRRPIVLPDAHVFEVKGSSGQVVAWFGDQGNLVLKGTLEIGKGNDPQRTYGDGFRFKDPNGLEIAIIDAATGNMYIRGKLYEDLSVIGPPPPEVANNFIVRDGDTVVACIMDLVSQPDLLLTGKVYQDALP